jgi:uncharacterized protein (DUF952 family)
VEGGIPTELAGFSKCPHIYGPIEMEAVIRVSRVERAEGGGFVAIEGITDAEEGQ